MTKINKEGWEVKKLNEVCSKGSSNIVISKLENNEGDYPLFGASGLVKNIDFFQQDKPYIGIVKDGAGVGRVGIYPAYSSLVGTMQYIFPTDNCMLEYIKYFLIKLNLAKHVSGATIPHIYFKDYGQEKIPVPSLNIQRRIVEELDEINAIISIKKKQIAKLDELAQSVFYTMFGDPVINEKEWKVSQWENVLRIINGKNQKAVESINGQYPICGSGGIMGYATQYLCPEHTTIIGRKGNINKPIYMKEKFWNVDTAFGLVADNVNLLPLYLYYFCIEFDFERLNKAVTIPSLTKADLQKISIPLPPLSLQQTFAARVEAIEDQKAAIATSIEKMQTLLDARMQEYFG